jgi:broad specificity phosphatase PhoE
MSFEGLRLYLLRHGEVESHRGDVPITPAALQQALQVGSDLADQERGPFLVLSGETRRALQTAEGITDGLRRSGAVVDGPVVAHALRNPDMYLAGVRVNMVSSNEAFAEQVPGLQPEDVSSLGFFPQFITEADRVGWWLTHEDPPGEGARAVAERIRVFARSLADPHPTRRPVVVAVTHSPLLRAAGLDAFGRDIGEPPWISGLRLDVGESGAISTEVFPGGA